MYLLQTRDNSDLQLVNSTGGQYDQMDSLLNHSGSSIETSHRERLSGGSGNGGLCSYPSSANSSVLPSWCSNGAESNTFGHKILENSHIQSPSLYEHVDRRQIKDSQHKVTTTKQGNILHN